MNIFSDPPMFQAPTVFLDYKKPCSIPRWTISALHFRSIFRFIKTIVVVAVNIETISKNPKTPMTMKNTFSSFSCKGSIEGNLKNSSVL